MTGDDISSDLLQLILPAPFSSMQGFTTAVVDAYVFAESYTGLSSDVSQVKRDDLQMIELLRWIKGISLPKDIPQDELSQVVWLEIHILERIRTREKEGAWVLLGFIMLSKKVVSGQWPACCIAAVRLAVLSHQYAMYERQDWDAHVAGLINQYPRLDVDPLGQACLAYLALTTSNPTETMSQNLSPALVQATFDHSIRIPGLVALLEPVSRNVALEYVGDVLQVVIVRRGDDEVVFSRPPDNVGWDLSKQRLGVTLTSGERELVWGPSPWQSVALRPTSHLLPYLERHEGDVKDQYMQSLIYKRLGLMAKLRKVPRPKRLRENE
ncbi:unnamed protein product [Aureobasidium uvarum]|uniref:Uncharacterized protein n=1 Tax=Aureobasidium uvarum TaxID=2773716 RepID=A0A9N8KA75_9PEZI|nr:unnamed protein product [Aureobasidium uvarum]